MGTQYSGEWIAEQYCVRELGAHGEHVRIGTMHHAVGSSDS
jgi:hypothetical protein